MQYRPKYNQTNKQALIEKPREWKDDTHLAGLCVSKQEQLCLKVADGLLRHLCVCLRAIKGGKSNVPEKARQRTQHTTMGAWAAEGRRSVSPAAYVRARNRFCRIC
jgi:hypothetical protein